MSVCTVDLTGEQVGRWTVIERVKPGWWLCECSCEEKTRKEVRQQDLQRGKSRSCGCLRREITAANSTTHGLSHTKEWRNKIAREWRKNNNEHVKARSKRYRDLQHVKTKNAERHKKWSTDNKDVILANKRKYRAENREKISELGARRRALKKQAIPKWGFEETKSRFKELKAEAIRLEATTGIKFHIDHIVPLCGMIDGVQVVSGLHVYSNLQLLQASDNCSKGPRSWPNMPDSML
jgi:hypothetical protein